jgi:Cft2 family RNA processing exonuclease
MFTWLRNLFSPTTAKVHTVDVDNVSEEQIKEHLASLVKTRAQSPVVANSGPTPGGAEVPPITDSVATPARHLHIKVDDNMTPSESKTYLDTTIRTELDKPGVVVIHPGTVGPAKVKKIVKNVLDERKAKKTVKTTSVKKTPKKTVAKKSVKRVQSRTQVTTN